MAPVMPAREDVVLVDRRDRATGAMEKQRAHVLGVLHRAISVIVLRGDGTLVLQRRAWTKYHSPGLWTNTCCTHPRLGEPPIDAAHRRLREEMGMACHLVPAFHFIYSADVGDGLWEHELDHVFVGVSDDEPRLNSDEVAEWSAVSEADVRRGVRERPIAFTTWFRILLHELEARPSWRGG